MDTVDTSNQKLKTEIFETLKNLQICLPTDDVEAIKNGQSVKSLGEFVDLRQQIEEMDLNATCDGSEDSAFSSRFSHDFKQKLRSALYQALEISKDIGGKFVKIGKHIVSLIFKLSNRFPKTSMAIFVLCVLLLFCNLIPWVGKLLQAAVITAFTALVPVVLLFECLEGLKVKFPLGEIKMPEHINL